MFNFILWVLFGAICGWIGYLATRTNIKHSPVPYLATGIFGAVVGGFITRGLGDSVMGVNSSSVFMAFMTSVLSLIALGFVQKTTSDR